MMRHGKLAVILAAPLLLAASGAGAAPAVTAEGLSLSGGAAYGAGLQGLTLKVREQGKVLAARRRNPALRRNQIPEVCENLPVVYVRNGDIFKNGEKLGDRAGAYKGNCDGHVVWKDTYGDLHLDKKEIGSRVNGYDISWYGDTVVWKTTSGELFVNGKKLGRVQSFTFVKYTGDVVWKDSWGTLYRNKEKFDRAQSFKVALRTGDVAWTDSYGNLSKNHEKLGRARRFEISDRTGDVAWMDNYSDLHKNDKEVARNPAHWELREDGVLIWRDSWGRVYYE